MSNMTGIQQLLDNTLEAIPSVPTHYKENQRIVDKSTQYMRSTMLPAATLITSIGPSPVQQLQGIYQVDVFSLSGYGFDGSQGILPDSELSPAQLADAIITVFKPSLLLTDNNGLFVRVLSAYKMSAGSFLDNKYYHTPIAINWISFNQEA